MAMINKWSEKLTRNISVIIFEFDKLIVSKTSGVNLIRDEDIIIV